MSTRKVKVSFRISPKDLEEIDYQISQGTFRDRSDFFTTAATDLLGKIQMKKLQQIQDHFVSQNRKMEAQE